MLLYNNCERTNEILQDIYIETIEENNRVNDKKRNARNDKGI